MAAVHGSKAGFRLGTFALPTTLVDVSTFLNQAGISAERDTGETSTFGVSSKKYIPGLKDGTVPLEGPYDSAVDQQFWDLFNNGTLVNFEYTPYGVAASGTPKFTGAGYLQSYEVSSEIGDAAGFTGEFQISGDVTRGTVP